MYSILRKGMIILLALSLVMAPAAAFAKDFSDVSDTDPLAEDINTLENAGYISGYPDGTFRLDGTITRAEFVHIANGIFGYTASGEVSNLFTDVAETDWFYKDILIAQQAGYVLGYPDGTFQPNGKITKEEVCSIYDRVLSLDLNVSDEQMLGVTVTDQDQISPWALNSVLRALYKGLVTLDADGNFSARADSDRGMVVYASARVLEKVTAQEIAPLSVIGGGGGGSISGTTTLSDYQLRVQRTITSITEIINDDVLENNKLKAGNIAAEKAFLTQLRANMQSYLDDPDNFDSAALYTTTHTAYLSLSSASQTELKRVVVANVDVIDLSKLRTFFGF